MSKDSDDKKTSTTPSPTEKSELPPYIGVTPGTPGWRRVWKNNQELQTEMLEYKKGGGPTAEEKKEYERKKEKELQREKKKKRAKEKENDRKRNKEIKKKKKKQKRWGWDSKWKKKSKERKIIDDINEYLSTIANFLEFDDKFRIAEQEDGTYRVESEGIGMGGEEFEHRVLDFLGDRASPTEGQRSHAKRTQEAGDVRAYWRDIFDSMSAKVSIEYFEDMDEHGFNKDTLITIMGEIFRICAPSYTEHEMIQYVLDFVDDMKSSERISSEHEWIGDENGDGDVIDDSIDIEIIPVGGQFIERKKRYADKYKKRAGDRQWADEGDGGSYGNILITRGEKPENGYPMLNAHLDTVQDAGRDCERVKEAKYNPVTDVFTMPGIYLGNDDKAGVAVALLMLKHTDIPLQILFTIQEEVGGGGIGECDAATFEDALWAVTVDRKNSTDIITKYGGRYLCPRIFYEKLVEHGEKVGLAMEDSSGSWADTRSIGAFVPCVNMSGAYYGPHRPGDSTIMTDLFKIASLLRYAIEDPDYMLEI